MAEEPTNPGIIASLMDALKPRETSPIPQTWLNEILALNKSMDARLAAIATFAKNEYDRNTVKVSVLDSLSDAVKLSFKESVINAFKEYDKEVKNSEATKEEEKKYKERRETEKKENEEFLEKQFNGLKSTAFAGVPGTAVAGESEAEKAIEELEVQPVSIQEIQEPALKSLENVFVNALASLKSSAAGGKEAGTVAGTNVPAGGGGFLDSIATGLQKLGTKEALMGAGTIVALGLALVVAAKGFQEFSKVDFAGLGKGFLSLLGLVAVTKLLASSTVQMLIGAAAIAALGAALFISAKGFAAFGEVDWESIGKGTVALLALGATAAIFGALIKVVGLGAIAIAALGVALIPFGFGLQIIAKGLQEFALVEWASVFKGFTALAGFGAIAGILGFAAGPMALFGLALLPFSLGMFTLAKALTAFANVSWDMIKTGMQALAGLGIVAGVLFPAAIAMAAFGVALLPFSLGMFTLAKALTAFVDVDWSMIKTGMLALGGLGAVALLLTPAAVSMGLFGIALLPFSLGMFTLAKALTAFASVSWDMIKNGMLALVGLGVVTAILTPAAISMALFGVALLPFSLGMFTLAKALTAFTEVSWDMIKNGMLALAGLGATTALLLPAAAAMGIFGIALLPFSLGLFLLARSLQAFANVGWDMIATGMLALTSLGAVTLLLLPAAAAMGIFGIALLPFSISMLLLAKALTAFANVTWDMISTGMQAIKNLGTVAALLLPAAAAMGIFGVALLPFSLGMFTLAKALTAFANVTWDMISTGMLALAGLGVVTALLLPAAVAMGIFGIALLPFSLGMFTLAKALTSFANVSWDMISTGMQAIGGLGAITLLLMPAAVSMALFGIALLPFSLGLYTLAKALTAFANVSWDMISTGMQAIANLGRTTLLLMPAALTMGAFGIALLPFSLGLMLLGNALTKFGGVDFSVIDNLVDTLIKFGVVGGILGLLSIPLALFGLALIPFGIGLGVLANNLADFLSLSWENVNEAVLTLIKFGLVGAVLGAVSPLLLLGATALGVFGIALSPFAEGLTAIIQPFELFVAQLERLANISAVDIGLLSASIVALGAAIAGFGAGSAAAGIGNFVGGLFSTLSGQKSPIEQLIAIGEQASNIDNVVGSISALKESLTGFGDIKANLDPLKQFVDIVNGANIAKVAAITAALAATAPTVALAATSPRPAATVATAPVATEQVQAETIGPGQVQTEIEESEFERPLRIETDQGPAVPVSVLPAKVESIATREIEKLSQNIENVAATPESELVLAPAMQQYSDDLRLISDRLEELINSIRPLIEETGGNNNILMPDESTTILANAPTITNPSTEINRDVPYIERNKYRQAAMYARGLL